MNKATSYPAMSKAMVNKHNEHSATTDKIKGSLAKPSAGMKPSGTAATSKGGKALKVC